ncbi:MAG: TrmJ/YjtD family RNA methyltransferase [Spirochaetales bacterium]|nr:TrmJ/YjtD family RNA methyltransferase [Spirochaetales bacterium]
MMNGGPVQVVETSNDMVSFVMDSALENIRIILVHPQDAKNVGAVCRAMKTMHVKSLAIVGRKRLDLTEVKNLAIHAYDVFEQAMTVSRLEEAIGDISLVLGVTRRRGKKRKYFSLSPEEAIAKIMQHPNGKAAFVFGNEESGLSDAELALCHVAVHIPSSPLFPSLNLSHAVQILAYLLYRESTTAGSHSRYTPITDEKLKLLVSVMIHSLKHIGFFTRGKPEDLGRFFKDILARAGLSGREAKRLETVFRKISGLVVKHRGGY